MTIDIFRIRGEVEDLLKKVSKEIILPRYDTLETNDFQTKSNPNDFVTIADKEAEKFLTTSLTTLIPNSRVVGEEAAYDNSSIMGYLDEPGFVWIIDPIDGTSNFIAGNPNFAIVIALVIDTQTVMGWIHDPIENYTVWSSLGSGTWIDDKQLKINKNCSDKLSELDASIYNMQLKRVIKTFRSSKCSGSAAQEYLSLVRNLIHISSFSRMHPWDHAAGVLIHLEAGGYSALLDGSDYCFNNNSSIGILSAPNRSVWEQVINYGFNK